MTRTALRLLALLGLGSAEYVLVGQAEQALNEHAEGNHIASG